jgi:cell wall-associated NlpC family hydrolase
MSELQVLARAHRLFGVPLDAGGLAAGPTADVDHLDAALRRASELSTGQDRYRSAVDSARDILRSAAATDTEFAALVKRAQQDRALARELTRAVLDAAREDRGAPPDSPVAQREAMRRSIARLRTQQQHVLTARRQARRRLALLLLLRYRGRRRLTIPGRIPLPPPGTRAGIAVRAALSRLGMPYVWGATGPDRFDCSGLVQWAYRQAGVGLDRTTYDQIHHGVAVPHGQVQPGDLVFPHAGHVQMAIGNGLVVEAPHAGANVRISPLGSDVVIRRPV